MKFLYAAFVAVLVSSCYSSPDQFGKLNLKKWRGDRGGCNGVRATLEPAFKAEIQNLKGKTANTIGDLLGRPDVNQIADRNQKFYIYFLEKGPQCNYPVGKSMSRSVAIRMSAIGLATEITFQNGIP
ncbi:hypothetical protein [Spirosoma pollinicola]|uniref:Lipoprotein SmpA/OmlA domain-containing protein n=1 Tax=Spirosoma pollinicola TaxID=2057025 RepID=A0A2K8YX25_9BACT|nr:hypothetical protein [Spirosoma pollinicola]AUD02187.1 hypothetical protein CWM47_10365 [Spirosoma pollinicola]